MAVSNYDAAVLCGRSPGTGISHPPCPSLCGWSMLSIDVSQSRAAGRDCGATNNGPAGQDCQDRPQDSKG